MEKFSRKNLRNIQAMVQDKTGAVIIPDRKLTESSIKVNIKKQMENGKKGQRTWDIRDFQKAAAAAAMFVLAAGLVSFPVRALVTSVVKERMESIPGEEVQEMNDMVQSKPTEADTFSRAYSDSEETRKKELWQAYKDGKFSENAIAQVDNEEEAKEGTLCYVRSTGIFNLPAKEMTDEELLEIIDFQHKMSYAVSQSAPAKEERAKMQAEESQLREKIQAMGGISEEEAAEIAEKQMKADLLERAEGKEILKYEDGSVAVIMLDISGQTDYEHKGDTAYLVHFYNPDDHSVYECTIDAMDGSILKTYKSNTPPQAAEPQT